ncbi:hypothetical protein [Alteromonas sp. B31-7]|uniref:hypothetical protein n=1 Tax=Alteromonas sp. B31-7 TaxID=2785913 RepID=UPI0018CAA36E|nr:hypothetical protein [Alteromonas sp. B31-7]QPL50810.1 hypothetical protein IUA53_04025 [Alteromonas sp. B31-7]
MNAKTKKIGVIAGVLISIAFTVLLFLAGKSIDYSVQEKYFENIRTVASIIFGVTGAWLAITYPRALSSAIAAKNSDSSERETALKKAVEDSKTLTGFISTMIVSIIIIALSLCIPFIKEILGLFQWSLTAKSYFRGALYVLLGAITVIQLGLLGLTLKHTYGALTDLYANTAKAKIRNQRDRNKEF